MSTYRGPIAFEDRPTLDGRVIAADALTWTAPFPVLDAARNPVGMVAAIDREPTDHGVALVAEVWFDTTQADQLPCGIELHDAAYVGVGEGLEFTAGRVAALVVYSDAGAPAWADARLVRVG